jgi:hypothetical protein
MMRWAAGAVFCALASGLAVVLITGCSGEEKPVVAPIVEPGAEPAAVAEVAVRVPSTTEHRFAARHILISWQGAVGALPNVSRTRDEARARAGEVAAKIKSGSDFAELAKAYSDDSTGPRGGSLGGFEAGTMVAPFEAAIKTLKVGEVSGLVETPFGFHLIKREALTEIHVAHLLVSWAGAANAPKGVTRSKEEARARATEAHDKALATPDSNAWIDVVRGYSDAPLKDDGGDLGWMAPGQMADVLDKAAFDLDAGAVSTVIETPVGFHVLRRLE